MSRLAPDWPDAIWREVSGMREGRGAAWRLPVAAIAVTGCRPAALERGVTFALVTDEHGARCIEARIPATKQSESRGTAYTLRWATDADTHRPDELYALVRAVQAAPGSVLTVSYDAAAISTRLRETSMRLWPRRTHHITGYCYREMLASVAKSSGASHEEIAAAMGHRSTESQGRYARAPRTRRGGVRAFRSAAAAKTIRTDRSPMARFRRASALTKIRRAAP